VSNQSITALITDQHRDPPLTYTYILESAEELRHNVQKHAFGCGLVGIIQRLALPCA
jgi:hypothetical protein